MRKLLAILWDFFSVRTHFGCSQPHCIGTLKSRVSAKPALPTSILSVTLAALSCSASCAPLACRCSKASCGAVLAGGAFLCFTLASMCGTRSLAASTLIACLPKFLRSSFQLFLRSGLGGLQILPSERSHKMIRWFVKRHDAGH